MKVPLFAFSAFSLFLSLICARAVTLSIPDDTFLESWTVIVSFASLAASIIFLILHVEKNRL